MERGPHTTVPDTVTTQGVVTEQSSSTNQPVYMTATTTGEISVSQFTETGSRQARAGAETIAPIVIVLILLIVSVALSVVIIVIWNRKQTL